MTARARQLQRCRLAIPRSYRTCFAAREGNELPPAGTGPRCRPLLDRNKLATGSGRGLAAIAMHPSSQGLLGGLLQWQASFAGQSDRGDTNALTVQPFCGDAARLVSLSPTR